MWVFISPSVLPVSGTDVYVIFSRQMTASPDRSTVSIREHCT
jgi:hypothetical protein